MQAEERLLTRFGMEKKFPRMQHPTGSETFRFLRPATPKAFQPFYDRVGCGINYSGDEEAVGKTPRGLSPLP